MRSDIYKVKLCRLKISTVAMHRYVCKSQEMKNADFETFLILHICSEELRLTAAQAYDLPLDYDDTGCSVFKKVCKIKNISI